MTKQEVKTVLEKFLVPEFTGGKVQLVMNDPVQYEQMVEELADE